MSAIDVTVDTFQADVVERSRTTPVVVDFWAPWCGPCRVLGPVLERLAAEAGGAWTLVKVDTDQNQELARRFGIQGIPAVKAFRDGHVVAEFVGVQPEPRLRQWLAGILPNEADTLAGEGLAALEQGRADEAETRLRAALEKDAQQPDALLALAARAIARGDRDGARGLLARLRDEDREKHAGSIGRLAFAVEAPPLDEAEKALAAAPESPSARYDLGLAFAAAGRWEAALEQFLAVVKRDRAWRDDAGRKAMLRVFDVVGVRSPLADEWRGRLSMELFK